LYFFELFKRVYKRGFVEMPKRKAIKGNRRNICSIEKVFLVREKFSSEIP